MTNTNSRSRRHFLLSSGALGFSTLAFGGCQSTGDPTYFVDEGDEFRRQLLLDESDQAFEMTNQLERTLLDSEWEPLVSGSDGRWDWWSFPSDVKTPVEWAPDVESPDYQPLLDYGDQTETAVISHELLEHVAERNAFSLGDDDIVVLGIRGSTLLDGSSDSGWASELVVKNQRPNHTSFNCLMGAWDRKGQRVRLFTASTVPEVNYMWSQAALRSGANLMPTGLYRYKVGTHSVNSSRSAQVGALRLQGHFFENDNLHTKSIYVLRSLNDLRYSINDGTELWDICQPYNNIHASIFGEYSEYFVGSKGQAFSSAGCQVVPGGYRLKINRDGKRAYTTEPIGAWKYFRETLGLAVKPNMVGNRQTSDDGKELYYMLLTGADFSLASSVASNVYTPLRPGSSGPRVEELQEFIGIQVDGNFGSGTAEAVVFFKKVQAEKPETPIVSSLTSLI